MKFLIHNIINVTSIILDKRKVNFGLTKYGNTMTSKSYDKKRFKLFKSPITRNYSSKGKALLSTSQGNQMKKIMRQIWKKR